MSGSKLYYIYLDTKIVGAVEQLIGYFRAQIFNKNDCISVICKFYKEINLTFSKLFKANDIPFIFVRKQSDLVLDKGKTVFYLFNAQSNCRLVANRDLTHIFVTHGESHKLASIKPIIRIYDYVITSGSVGIERYLKAGVFTSYDVDSGKIITLGDTFLGGNGFSYNKNSNAIIYAPTWEGGVPEENYCSININNTQRILDFCVSKNITRIYIKPHPNLGHRDVSYKLKLQESINKLQHGGIRVIIIKNTITKTWHKFFQNYITPTIDIEVKYAITDISAMEMQFIRKKIPCSVLIDNNFVSKLIIPKFLDKFYSKVFLAENDEIIFDKEYESQRDELYNYFFTYPSSDVENKIFRDRIIWLCLHTKKHLNEHRESLINSF